MKKHFNLSDSESVKKVKISEYMSIDHIFSFREYEILMLTSNRQIHSSNKEYVMKLQ